MFIFCDIPEPYQKTIQDPATETLEWMIDFYDLICFELIIVVSIISVLLFNILYSAKHHEIFKKKKKYSQLSFSHSTELEIFWTILPALLLISIAYPSFNLLYALDDDSTFAKYTVKVLGHQWYWTYEVEANRIHITFDSYMIPFSSKRRGIYILKFFRLLDVDNQLFLSVNSKVDFLITSADVLHSWAIPSFGIKVDACPGRLSRSSIYLKRTGVFFGQCSEICGVNHGFMPIVVHVAPKKYIVEKCYEIYHNKGYTS